jgi:uncharacterized membrane protein HdeD (DUF308 family)
VHVIQTLTKNWWMLVLCGLLEAIISIIYLIMQDTSGPLTFHAWNHTIALLGEVALVTGGCAIAAGVCRSSTGKCWLLVLNGLALAGLGLIYYGLIRFRISFLTIALLIIVMATTLGILGLGIARTFRRQRHVGDGWFLGLVGAISATFALGLLVWSVSLASGWIKIQPGSHPDLLWLGLYFGFSAVCMLALGLRLHNLRYVALKSLRPLPV